MNTGGLNWPWTLTHVQSKDMTAHLTAGIRHSPGLENGMATHSIIIAWKIPWTEEPDELQSMGSQKS